MACAHVTTRVCGNARKLCHGTAFVLFPSTFTTALLCLLSTLPSQTQALWNMLTSMNLQVLNPVRSAPRYPLSEAICLRIPQAIHTLTSTRIRTGGRPLTFTGSHRVAFRRSELYCCNAVLY